MRGVVELRGLVVPALIGVLPEELDRRQPLEVDLDVHVDIGAAAVSDELTDAVDYGAVCAAVDAVRAVCAGEGPSAASPKGDRFRWLTSPRSTVVQPGPVHAGMTDSPEAEQARLVDRMVR